MRQALVVVSCLILLLASARAEDAPATAAKAAVDVEVARLMTHVRWLAAPERKGRGAWPEREASAAYIAQAFAAAGLKPLPGRDSMFVDKAGLKQPALRNVVAWLPGPKGAAGEHVILSSHYDHLGQKVTEIRDGETVTRTTMTFAGADDNASGVAALLEIARCLGAQHKADPKAFPRSLVFVAFDLEETNLLGSRHYVQEPPLPLAGCAAFLTMDMLGRSVGDMVPGSLFVMGGESSAVLAKQVVAGGEPKGGKTIKVGIDFQPGYSDYVAFQEAKIPFLFLTSGACEDYHQTGDVAARIQGAHLRARARWAQDLTMRIVASPTRPTWRDGVPPSVAELKDVRALIKTIEAEIAKVPGLPPMATAMVTNYGAYLDKLLADDQVTLEERTNARNGALNLFRMAQQMAVVMNAQR
ncbi:MAG: M28 family peptidase [Planctomycetota bacterium]|nr:M28 family peptidase [Planctomycetota bacterium]